MPDVVAITTVRQGDPSNEVERVRAQVFLDTAQALHVLHIPCVAIYVDCQEEYLSHVRALGVMLIEQREIGMGNIRREGFRAGLRTFPSSSYLVWLEPEKPALPSFIEELVALMRKSDTNLGLFNRLSMDSYPKEQARYYMFCRSVASALLGFDIDYAFGPMIMSRQAARYFLDYRGEYGDKWESILIPRLRVLKEDGHVALLPVNFRNDSRMLTVESGNITMIQRRVEQFTNVVPSLITECERLK